MPGGSGLTRGLVTTAAAVLLAGACGTTVNSRSLTGTGDGGSGLGGLAAPSGSASGSGSGNGTDGVTAGAAASGSAPTHPGSGVLADSGAGAFAAGGRSSADGPTAAQIGATVTGVPAGPKVPGVTATSIYVGFAYASESSSTAANQALGAGGVTQGNTQGEAQAIIGYINSHGGVLGRKLVPVWYQENALSTESSATLFQGECQAFEQDNHVFAYFDGGNAIAEQCAQKAGAVAIYDNLSLSSAHTFVQYPSYFEVGGMMDQNRMLLNEANGLAAQKYFSGWDSTLSQPATSNAKVGVITYDTPDFRYAVGDVLLPQLGRLGYAPASQDVVYVAEPQGNSDLGAFSAAVSNAVLRFHGDGVDHVLIADVSALITLEFLNTANSQHYYPRYGFNSQNGPQVLATAGDVPTAQLNGALGIGWSPMIDLPSGADPDNGPYSNDARRQCLAIMRAAGFSYPDTNSESAALSICTSFEFLNAAVTAGGPAIDQSSFIAGANRLGFWNGAGETFGDFYGPAQHDGAGYYRYYDWNGSCGCMQYNGGNLVATGEGES